MLKQILGHLSYIYYKSPIAAITKVIGEITTKVIGVITNCIGVITNSIGVIKINVIKKNNHELQ